MINGNLPTQKCPYFYFMRRYIIYPTALCLLFAFGSQAQKKSFTIQGNIADLNDNTEVYLVTGKDNSPVINRLTDTVGRTAVKNGRFTFEGTVPNAAKFYMITIREQKGNVQLVLGNEDVTVSGKLADWPNAEIKGSVYTAEKDELVKVSNELKSLPNANDTIGKYFTSFIKSHTGSFYAPFLIVLSNYTTAEKQEFYNNLTTAAKASYYGTKLKENIAATSQRDNIKEGAVIPDFAVSTPDGNKMSLLDAAKKSKYTLVDFWASWCRPCRAEVPNMKKVYEAFHDKGFNIVGISTDKGEADWKRALAEDNSPWSHGLDNIADASKMLFDINAIPAFALLDKDGKLVALSSPMSSIKSFGPELRGEALHKTIAALLGE